MGGGCRLDKLDGKQCDDDYQSEDGKIKFTVYTDNIGHTYLPEEFEFSGQMSEIKMFELQEIEKAKTENLKNTLSEV